MSFKPIITAILFLGTIGLLIFAVWPNYQEFRSVANKLDIEEKRLAQLEDHFKKLEELNERLKEHEDIKAQLDAALPGYLSVPEFFIYLQQVSDRNGLLLGDLTEPSISESKARPGIKEASFSLSFKGTYETFKNLLSDFWRNAKLIDVDSVSFSVPEEGNVFDFNVNVRTYSY